eukprot:4116003-Alexandrium_andersonii.AAC.1
MQAHIDAGRCIVGMVDVGRREPLVVASVYGWQGSSTDCKARERTRELVGSLMEELALLRGCCSL